MRRCYVTGCSDGATDVLRSVSVKLPGHPSLVNIGDVNVCPRHKTELHAGRRTNLRDDVITAALVRRV